MRTWLYLTALLVSSFPQAFSVFADDAGVVDWHHVLVGHPIRDSTFFHRPHPGSKATLLYTLSERNVVAAVNPKDGDVVWRQALTGNCTSGQSLRAGHSSDTVVTGLGSEVIAWAAADGRQIWSRRFSEGHVVDLEILELETVKEQGNKDSVVVVAGSENKVVRLHGETGVSVWEYRDDSGDTPHQISASATQIFYVTLHSTTLGGWKVKVVVLDPTNGKKVEQHSLSSESDVTDPSHILSVGANSASPVIIWTDKLYTSLKVNIIGTKGIATFPITPKGESITNITLLAPSNANSRPHFLVHYATLSESWAQVYHVDRQKGTVVKAYDLPRLKGKSAFSVTSEGSNVYFTRITGEDVSVTSSASHGVLAKWRLKGFASNVSHPLPLPVHATTELSVKGESVSAARSAVLLSSGEWVLIRDDSIAWSREEDLAHAITAAWAYPPNAKALVAEKEERQALSSNPLDAYIRRWIRHLHQLQRLPTILPKVFEKLLASLGLADRDNQDVFAALTSFGFHKIVVVATSSGRLIGLDTGAGGKVQWNLGLPNQWLPISGLQPALTSFPEGIMEWKNDPSKESGYLFDGTTGLAVEKGKPQRKARPSSEVNPIQWHFTPPKDEIVISTTSRPEMDPIASIGRVLGDRRVLYKYINPNLQLIATRTPDRNILTTYLVDSLTGETLYSTYHADFASDLPFAATISENWFSYTFTSLSTASTVSTQLVIGELYESPLPDDRGPSNLTLRYPSHRPHLEIQTYIVPEPISELSTTQTSQGITSKDLLAYLPNSNALIGIPRAILDPRRPVGRDPTKTEQAEGLMRYAPALELDPKWSLSHRREVVGVRGVSATPAVLESTSLVVAWGLDVFGTRTSPSFAFDVLGGEFDKVKMLATVAALFVLTVGVAPLVGRKGVDARWSLVS